MTSLEIKPIGVFNSIFTEKLGLPRQEGLVKETTGFIQLTCENAEQMLEGLGEFSHIWVLYLYNQKAKKNTEILEATIANRSLIESTFQNHNTQNPNDATLHGSSATVATANPPTNLGAQTSSTIGTTSGAILGPTSHPQGQEPQAAAQVSVPSMVETPPKTKGVFATRTPKRPNPIGMSLLKLEAIQGRKVYLSGVDIVNQTAIIDIRPYIPEFDAISIANLGWAKDQRAPSMPVEFTQVALDQANQFFLDAFERERFLNMIVGIIEKDPRPVAYRKKKYTGFLHGMSVGDQNIQFCFDGNKFLIENIEPV